jgi:hypothetical protein
MFQDGCWFVKIFKSSQITISAADFSSSACDTMSGEFGEGRHLREWYQHNALWFLAILLILGGIDVIFTY